MGLAFFKPTRTRADYGRMPQATKLLAALALAPLVAALLVGGGSSREPTPAVAIVKSGILGSFGDELQREDDEDEVSELREMELQTPSERQEAHEQAEAGEGGKESGESAAPASEGVAPAGEGAEAIASTGEGEAS